MREIVVSTDVFASIWSLRMPGEERENDILERVLNDYLRVSPVVAADLAGDEDENAAAVTPKVAEKNCRPPKEAKTSIQSQDNLRKDLNQLKGESMGKIRWVDDVRSALSELGGQSGLHSLYKKVEERRRNGNRSVPRTLEATIRRTLEDHSSDSANFRGADIFARVGRGEWALR